MSRMPLLVVLALFIIPTVGAMAATLPDYTPDANTDRSTVPDVYKWSLAQLYPSVDAWEQEMTSLAGAIPQLKAFEGRLANPRTMKECLDLYFGLHDRASHLTQYANLELDTEQSSEAAQSRQQRSLNLMNDLMAAVGFMRGEILAVDDPTMALMYRAQNGPGQYRDYLENLRRRKSRVLGAEAERVLQLAGDNLWAEIDLNEIPSPLETTFGALLGSIAWPMVHDASGNEVQLTLSNLGRFRASPDRAVRA